VARWNWATDGSTSKPAAATADIEEVRRTPVAGNGAAVVRLGDVADVQWTTADKEDFGRYNGERAVFVTVRPREGQNLLALSEGLRAEIERFRAKLPGDVRLEVGWGTVGECRDAAGSAGA